MAMAKRHALILIVYYLVIIMACSISITAIEASEENYTASFGSQYVIAQTRESYAVSSQRGEYSPLMTLKYAFTLMQPVGLLRLVRAVRVFMFCRILASVYFKELISYFYSI